MVVSQQRDGHSLRRSWQKLRQVQGDKQVCPASLSTYHRYRRKRDSFSMIGGTDLPCCLSCFLIKAILRLVPTGKEIHFVVIRGVERGEYILQSALRCRVQLETLHTCVRIVSILAGLLITRLHSPTCVCLVGFPTIEAGFVLCQARVGKGGNGIIVRLVKQDGMVNAILFVRFLDLPIGGARNDFGYF